MRYDYIDLFIPEVKVYGFVFTVDEEPILYIVDGNNILDGIPIYGDFEDEFDEYEGDEDDFEDDIDNEESDIYMLLDSDETILVGVEILDDEYNEKSVKDITDDNYEEFIYNLLPLKLHTLDIDDLSIEDIITTDKFKKNLLTVVSNYKSVLKKSKY